MKKFVLAMLLLVVPLTAQAETIFTIAPKAVYYSYHEQVMDETGYLSGVKADVEHTTSQGLFLGIEAEGLAGELRYDGGYSDGTSVICDTHDILVQATAAVGHEFTPSSWNITPYTGLKFRYWRDYILTEGGYLRQISQYYLPVGLNVQYQVDDSWSFRTKIEGSLLLSGRVASDLSNAGSEYSDVANHQNFGRGLGARILATLEKDFGEFGLGISPSFEWYEVNRSKITTTQVSGRRARVVEPHNVTMMFGLSFDLFF